VPAEGYDPGVAEAKFEQSIDIAVPPRVVHAFLGNLHHYRSLHPLIERVEDLAPTRARPDAHRYRVTDRMRFGPFRYRFAYVAELEATSSTEVRGTAWQDPGIEVHTRYRIAPVGSGTRLHEDASIQAPRLLLGFVRRRAEAAHRETLAKLKARLESGATDGVPSP
jgi:hypothetical protein